jgi:hypothetical protein
VFGSVIFNCNIKGGGGIKFVQYDAKIIYECISRLIKVINYHNARWKPETGILCSLTFFSLENLAVYKIMWKRFVEMDRKQMTIWRMRITCWMNMATDTQSVYIILIAFPLLQWLHEHASLLRFTYIPCLVSICTLWGSIQIKFWGIELPLRWN